MASPVAAPPFCMARAMMMIWSYELAWKAPVGSALNSFWNRAAHSWTYGWLVSPLGVSERMPSMTSLPTRSNISGTHRSDETIHFQV